MNKRKKEPTLFECTLCNTYMEREDYMNGDTPVTIIQCPFCGHGWYECVECHADEAMKDSNICKTCASMEESEL